MFRTRRKPLFKNRRRSLYTPYRKKRKPLNRWQIVLAVALAFMGIELLTRILFGITGKAEELAAYNDQPSRKAPYGLSFVDESGRIYEGLSESGELNLQATALNGYRLYPNQSNSAWSINEQGFRSATPTSLTKSDDEIRVFVMGGSAAFGQGASNNDATFANQLQVRLNNQVVDQKNNPGNYRPTVLSFFADEASKQKKLPAPIQAKRYNVVNAAVPGYISSNQLAHLAHQVLSYQPDLIILLSGYEDLLLPSDFEAARVPDVDKSKDGAIATGSLALKQTIGGLLNRSALLKSIRYWGRKPDQMPSLPPARNPDGSEARLATEATELEQRIQRFESNLQKIATITSNANIPLIVAVQPEVSSRIEKGITDSEVEILEKLGNDYPQQIQQSYQQLREGVNNIKNAYPGQVLPLTLTDLYNGETEPVFLGPTSMSDVANQKLAEKFYGAIAARFTVESIPFAAAQ